KQKTNIQNLLCALCNFAYSIIKKRHIVKSLQKPDYYNSTTNYKTSLIFKTRDLTTFAMHKLNSKIVMTHTKKLVVVGGGFAGLELVKRLGNCPDYQIVLVDTNNYNFFPPLIYQVSTGFMEPSAISYPFRKILRNKKSVGFRLGELKSVVPSENKIVLSNGELNYDILVMATGTETNFF